jgi:hypothetical protein
MVEYLIALEKAKNGAYRNVDDTVLDKISKGTREIYTTYRLVPYIHTLFEDILLGNDGDLTSTRDYREYLKSFDDGAKRKYEQIEKYLKPGKIVDIGCCAGSLIEEMTKNPTLQDTDFYGVEVARVLYEECKKRKGLRYFKNENVFFLKKNVAANKIFKKDNMIDTFTSFSLTHEVYSYQSKQALEKMITLIADQLKPGGRRINNIYVSNPGIIRRFCPKGLSIQQNSEEYVKEVERK